MDKQEEQQSKPEEQKSHKNKKVLIIAGGIIAVLLFVIAAVLLQGTGNEGSNTEINLSITPSQSGVNPSQPINPRFNPLINNKEVDRVESAFRKKMQEAGISISPKPDYKFQYKLDPGLENKRSFRLIEPVLAANTCNINSAPLTLPIYSLKDHLTVVDAKEVAATFDIKDDPKGSLPSLGGSSFNYFFADAVVSQYLEVNETAGFSNWHRVVDAAGTNSGQDPQTIAQTELAKHKLSDKAELKSTKTDPATGSTVFHYEKNYDNLVMTDKASIKALGPSFSVCSVANSPFMNYVDIYVSRNGYFWKLTNTTRQIVASYPVKRATLEESLAEYQTYLPIDPIVIGGTDTTGEVTIDEAVLVWYDYGDIMPQTAYIPMYLTSGRTPTGTRVLTLFPAVTKQTMNDTKIPQLSSQSRDTLQLYTFNPPFANPPPPMNPGKGTPYPTIPGLGKAPVCNDKVVNIDWAARTISNCSGKTFEIPIGEAGNVLLACYGGQADYGWWCTDSSDMQVCYGVGGVPQTEDLLQTCINGPQQKSETVDLPDGSSPCDEIAKRYNLGFSTTVPAQYDSTLKYTVPYKGPVLCQISTKPC